MKPVIERVDEQVLDDILAQPTNTVFARLSITKALILEVRAARKLAAEVEQYIEDCGGMCSLIKPLAEFKGETDGD